MVILEVRHLKKTYVPRFGGNQVHALTNVNFSVEQGEYVAIMGPSGSGKTTLMNIIGCLDRPTSGTYELAGENVLKLKDRELSDLRLKSIGFVFQSFQLMPRESAVENVALPLTFRGEPRKERIKKADRMLDLVSLEKHKKHLPNQLSGGQQQRVSVARALVNDPKIIFADEPTGNLDSHTSEEVMKLMQQVVRQQKKTLVMVTHDNHLATYADRVFHISDGKIIKIEDHRSGTEHTEDRDKAISGNMNPGDTEYLKR